MLWTGCWETLGSDDVDGTNLCSAHLREEESSLGQGMSNKAIQCLWGRFKFELLNSSKLLLTYSWCDCDSQMVVDRTWLFEIHAILSGTWNRSSHVLVVIENLLLIPVESVEYLQVRRLVSLRIFMISGMYQRSLEAVQYMAPSLKSHHLCMNIFIYILYIYRKGYHNPNAA